MLEELAEPPAEAAAESAPSSSLGIGSLRDVD
jgi:hypothetical protein